MIASLHTDRLLHERLQATDLGDLERMHGDPRVTLWIQARTRDEAIRADWRICLSKPLAAQDVSEALAFRRVCPFR